MTTTTAADFEDCTWTSGNDPCPSCFRRVTALHCCKLLQDELAAARQTDSVEQVFEKLLAAMPVGVWTQVEYGKNGDVLYMKIEIADRLEALGKEGVK